MLAYLRCIARNRASLAGVAVILTDFCLFVCHVFCEPPNSNEEPTFIFAIVILFVFGFYLLGVTGLGFQTYHTYKRVMAILERDKGEDRLEKISENISKFYYCDKVGFDMALEDARRRGWI